MSPLVALAVRVALGLALIGILAASVRLVLGPSRADRVVALDLITVLLVAIAALLVLVTGKLAYLDLSLALALIGFLATVAFARYVEHEPDRMPDGSEESVVPTGATDAEPSPLPSEPGPPSVSPAERRS